MPTPQVDVHTAITAAALVSKGKTEPTVSISGKVSSDIADAVKDICERAGTNTSQWIAACANQLASDYRNAGKTRK